MFASAWGVDLDMFSGFEASSATFSKRTGASIPAFANAQTRLVRFCELKEATFKDASSATAWNSKGAGEPLTAKAQTVLAKAWGVNVLNFVASNFGNAVETASKRRGAATPAFAKAQRMLESSWDLKDWRCDNASTAIASNNAKDASSFAPAVAYVQARFASSWGLNCEICGTATVATAEKNAGASTFAQAKAQTVFARA
mmetsp:Transcript_8338/g.27449  ORF Transcript_8338/g.27449 Transcript_8338/m.27449 type:complete len:200 (+) Transcript_8338:975-1574(+)